MNVLLALTLVLMSCTILIFKKAAFYMITGTFSNFLLFVLLLFLLSRGWSVYPVTMVIFLAVAASTLFYINDVTIKTKAAFLCVVLFLLLFTLVTLPLIHVFRTHGFALEELEELAGMDFSVKVPFASLSTSIMLMSFSGAVIDSSMAVSSATYEVSTKTNNLTLKELIQSSMNVVHDIVSSTINTLLFAFMGSSLALIIWLQDLNYSFAAIINSKAFAGELLISILTSAAAIIILPLSAVVTSYVFFSKT